MTLVPIRFCLWHVALQSMERRRGAGKLIDVLATAGTTGLNDPAELLTVHEKRLSCDVKPPMKRNVIAAGSWISPSQIAGPCLAAIVIDRVAGSPYGGKLGGKNRHREETDRAADHQGPGCPDPMSDGAK